MKTFIIIKKKWFDNICNDTNPMKQIYKNITPYNSSLFLECKKNCKLGEGIKYWECLLDTCPQMKFKPIDSIQLHTGSSKTTATFQVKKLFIGEGFTKWGAAPGVEYFVLVLGNRIEESNEN